MNRDEIMAMEAGREMDALVAERVMGWEDVRYEEEIDTEYYAPADWYGKATGVCPLYSGLVRPYSTDIAAAWEVVEKLYDEQWIVGIGSLAQKPRGWRCELCNMWVDDFERSPTDIEANGNTASLAICKAAIIAVMEWE